MSKHVSLNEASKSDDWKCTERFNAGDQSHRVYESEKTGERVVEDGKEEKWDLDVLSGRK